MKHHAVNTRTGVNIGIVPRIILTEVRLQLTLRPFCWQVQSPRSRLNER